MIDMKATVLVDNISANGICGEWGLCVYIEYNGKNILLDAGSSALFITNAEKLGKNLKKIDYGVLSHAHYDHANGIPAFLELNKRAKFYISKNCEANCFDFVKVRHHYIGVPKNLLNGYKNRLVPVDGVTEVSEGVWIVPHSTEGLGSVGEKSRMYRRLGRRYIPDDFSHEQSLVFVTEKGLVIFNSCSHSGPEVIVSEVKKAFPKKKIAAYIGGLHLFRRSNDEVLEFAEKLKKTGVKKIYTGHCTGERPYNILKEELGNKVEHLCSGLVMEF